GTDAQSLPPRSRPGPGQTSPDAHRRDHDRRAKSRERETDARAVSVNKAARGFAGLKPTCPLLNQDVSFVRRGFRLLLPCLLLFCLLLFEALFEPGACRQTNLKQLTSRRPNRRIGRTGHFDNLRIPAVKLWPIAIQ